MRRRKGRIRRRN